MYRDIHHCTFCCAHNIVFRERGIYLQPVSSVWVLLILCQTLHTHQANKNSKEAPMTTWQLFKSPGVAQVILIFNYVMVLGYTFTAVNPVYMYTPIELGGIGFTPVLIAGFTAIAGASQAIWLLLVFPRLHKRVGTGRVLFYCACAWPIFFASSVVFNTLLRHNLKATFWATAPLTLALGSGVSMAFSTCFNRLIITSLTLASGGSACGQ
jgi:hypothetical protein